MFDPEPILHSEVVKARFEAAGEATERCPESYRGGGFPATIRLALSLTRRRPCNVCGTPAREVRRKRRSRALPPRTLKNPLAHKARNGYRQEALRGETFRLASLGDLR